MGFGDFQLNNNGKKEVLQNAKNGVRKEQVDKKFHNLFDAYDINKDGTLESNELNEIFNGLSSFAGDDKVLDTAENQLMQSVFAEKMNIENADFMGFVKSVSTASADIVSSEETATADGGKEVRTEYADGTVETISYYPDGEYKFKETIRKVSRTEYFAQNKKLMGLNTTGEKISKKEFDELVQLQKQYQNSKSIEELPTDLRDKVKKALNSNLTMTRTTLDYKPELELSERAKQDVSVRDFVLNHYIETHQAAKNALESMGIFDDTGAFINASAGEAWNAIKNKWNGTEEEYQNFYELKEKFAPSYDKSLQMQGAQKFAQQHLENYFRGDIAKIDSEKGVKFQAKTEQYQNAQILKERLNLLKTAMYEVEQYQVDQGLLLHSPATSEGINPASHIVKANELLLQYFGGDQNAVDMILNGAIGDDNAKVVQAIKDIYNDTQKMNEAVLGGKSFDEVQDEYKTQYKEMYNTDFVPDELTEKVMDAKATGSFVKLAAITIISVLITRSPIMAQINAGIAGSAGATGAAANLVKTLVVKYGQNAVAQGIQFAMTSGTLATDVGLTLLNQVTSERGVNGEELWESTKSSAKFIYFGAYVGGPLAQAVSKQLGKIGAASRMFEGGVKASNGAVQTTTIAGDKLMQNLMKGGNAVLTKGSAFLTDVAAFTALEVATDGQDVATAGKEQLEFLPKLKIINGIIEYMLGGKVHAGMVKAKMDAAIEQSGVKNWEIKEIKSPTKSMYEVKIDKDMPPIRFENANDLATAMSEAVAGKYEKLNAAKVKAEQAKADNTPLPQGAREQSDVRASNTENNFDNMTARLKKGHVNYTLSATEDGRKLVKIENSTELFTANRFDYYEFDKDGKLVKSQVQTSEASAKEMFTDFKNAQTRNIRNRGGRLNAGVPVMDIAEGLDANVTSRNVRNEVGNTTAAPKANTILDKKFDETTIPQAKTILEELGFSKEEIATIDLKDSDVQRSLEVLHNAVKYEPRLRENFDNEVLLESLKDKELLKEFLEEGGKYFTTENCELLAKQVIFDKNGGLYDIFRDYSHPEILIKLLPVLTQNGKHKVLGSELQQLGYGLDKADNIAKVTPENVDFIYKINEKIENKNYALELRDILDLEDTTPEFINNYVKETNRFAKYDLSDVSARDITEIISKRKAVSDFLEEYPIDLSSYDYSKGKDIKLSGHEVYCLSEYTNKADVQKFVNSLSKEAKAKDLNCAAFIDEGFSVEKLSNLLNETASGGLGEIQGGMHKLLSSMLKTGSKDYDGMVDLVMAYKGTKCLSWYGNEKYVQVANGDFKGAAKYIELAKELKMDEEHFGSLLNDENADFKSIVECLTYIKENNIDISTYHDYELLRDKNWKENIAKIEYLKTAGVERLEDMYIYICTDLKSDISFNEFKTKFEYVNEFIAKNQNISWRQNPDYCKVKIANNELSMDKINELCDLAQKGNLSSDETLYFLLSFNNVKLSLAEKLCADKDFPKERIAYILCNTNKDNLSLAEKLCADKDFPKEKIGNILRYTNKDNLSLAEKLCADKDFPKEEIGNILCNTNKDNLSLAEKLCADKNSPKEKIGDILKATIINDPNDIGGNNGKTDAKKVDRYARLFQNPNTAKFANNNLKQGLDIETISKLAPTKQSCFTESVKPTETTQKIVEQKAVSPLDAVKQETIKDFENLGLDTKQANAVFKSIAKNGVVDTNLKTKAIELINKGVAKNKIGDILNSAQITGEFNSKIVDDFILLQNRGLNPLLEKNLAVLNNISGADCAVKFNPKVRNQMKAMINNLPDAVKISLKEQGIVIDSILKKLDAQIVRTSNNVPAKAKVENGFRSKVKITGFERIVVDKYEPTEQVWRNEEATKKWAEEKYLAFKNREYVSTRNTAEDALLGEKVTQKRKEVLKEWYDFMETDENIKNNPFVKVILCDFITKELDPERSTTPPAFNKAVVKEILSNAANSTNFSFGNAYAKKMKDLSEQSSKGQKVEINGRRGTWYTVPRTDSSSPDFKANAAKVRAFSDGTNWCIRTWNAEPYVQEGAMHFFVDENGLTQICIRENGAPGSVYEIQKRQQDQTAPVAYLDVIQSYMKEHGLKPQNYCQNELDKAIAQKPEYDKLKSELDPLNNKKDYKGIFEKMGISVTVLPDGTFELSHYTSYINKIALNDFGINENELLANVSKIKGDANFRDSNATTLPNLSEVGGKLDFGYANISNIKNLKSINGLEIKWKD